MNKKNKTYLVTGGLGFIGSNFIENILKKKINIINVDNCSYASNLKNNDLFIKNKNYKFIKCSIGNTKKISKLLLRYKPNIIVNIAAETHVDNSISSPLKFIHNNISEFAKFLEACTKYFNNNKELNKKFRIIHVSTDEVYGSLKSKEKSFKEINKFLPNSPYSSSKAASDLLCRAWYKTYNLPIIVTNCSNNYGKFQHKEKLIPKIILNILNNKRIPIYARGLNVREWLHVLDHCLALQHIIKYGKLGETYNIGSRFSTSNIKLVNLICSIVDKKFKSKKSSKRLITFVKDRKAHDFRYSVNYSKIKRLGWKPKINFYKGLNSTINWYIKNYHE